jgi:hypothetical protein
MRFHCSLACLTFNNTPSRRPVWLREPVIWAMWDSLKEDEYCFMPFHVYEGLSGKYITSVLRAGKTPTVPEIISVLKRIVRRIRITWPHVRIIVRADGLLWPRQDGLAPSLCHPIRVISQIRG